jgi:prepilin-type N-terminal cleavage/methylation domain-containing protein
MATQRRKVGRLKEVSHSLAGASAGRGGSGAFPEGEAHRPPQINEAGFTLLEMILVIILLAVGLVPLLSALSSVTRGAVNAEIMTTAQELAQEHLEYLISKKRNDDGNYADADADDGYYTTPDLDVGTVGPTSLAPSFPGYTLTVEICQVDAALQNPVCTPPAADTGYRRITVSISYSGLPDLSSPVVSLVTVITNVLGA